MDFYEYVVQIASMNGWWRLAVSVAGFCPSCGARRMIDSAALLVDTILPRLPMRQWVLSFPYHLRLLFARQPLIISKVLAIVYRTISTFLVKKAGFSHKTARTGAVTLIQRFGSSLNLNIHPAISAGQAFTCYSSMVFT